MVSAVETQKPKINRKINRILWLSVVLLLALGIGGYYYFDNLSLLLRIIGLLAVIAICVLLAYQTTQGKAVWAQWLEAVSEVRRIVWPTRKEIIQTTLAVLAMVLVLGLLLWTTDYMLLKGIGWLTGFGSNP